MRRYTRAVAILLCASFALSTCSCSGKFQSSVEDAAEAIGKAVVARDYKKLMKVADKEDEDLEGILGLSSDSSEEADQAREIIASTLTYEVDPDSYDGDFMGKEGCIDVIFEYVDYESVTEDVFFPDINAFEQAIEDCKDTVEVRITFDFISDGGKTLCTNISEVEDLFPYSSEEFEFAQERSSYAGDITFFGVDSTNALNDTSDIQCELAITGDGQQLQWDYYWTVELDGNVIYTLNDVINAEDPTSLAAYYSSNDGEILPDGIYVFTYYTLDDEMIATGSVIVSHTVTPTPTPVPTAAPSAPSGSGTLNEGYIYPDSDNVQLPDTDLVFLLPEGMEFRAADDPEIQALTQQGLAEYLLLYCSGDASIGDNIIYFCDFDLTGGVRTSAAQIVFDTVISGEETFLQDNGYEYTLEYTDYEVAGNTFTAANFDVTMLGTDVCFSYMLVGDSDAFYVMVVVAGTPEERDAYLTSYDVVE